MGGPQAAGVLTTVKQDGLAFKGKPQMTEEEVAKFQKPILDKYEKEGICINDCFEILWYEQKKIKYLHQLQNLYFALTGKELDVKL